MSGAITVEMKQAALRRELAFRRSCYPRWIREGRMTKAFAEEEINIMQAILDDYRGPDLFDTAAAERADV